MRKIIAVAFTAALMLGGTAWAGDWNVTGAAGGTTVVVDGTVVPAANPGDATVIATDGDATLTIGAGVAATNDKSVTFTSTANGVATFEANATATSFTNTGTMDFIGTATNATVIDLTNVTTVTNNGTMSLDEFTSVTSFGVTFQNLGTMTIAGINVANTGSFENSGTLNTTGEALLALNLVTVNDSIGTINLTNALTGDYTIAAVEGTFNVNGTQTGSGINVGTADINFYAMDEEGQDNTVGAVTGGTVTMKTDSEGVYGDITATTIVVENGAYAEVGTTNIGSVTIDNGGTVVTNGATTFTAAADPNQVFNANAGSELDIVGGNLTLAGYDAVNLNGIMDLAPGTSIEVTAGNVTVGSDSTFVIDRDYALSLTDPVDPATNVLIDASAAVTGGGTFKYNGASQINNLFGQFGLDVTDGVVGIDSAANNTFAGNWAADANLATSNLRLANDHSAAMIGRDLVLPVYLTQFADPAHTIAFTGEAGEYNQDWFESLAHGATTHGWNKTMLAADVADALLGGMSNLRSVTGMVGVQQANLVAEINSAASGDANATFMLNNNNNNRIWAGYVGSWEDGDRKNGIEGYKYDTNGFIIGYDRIIAERFAAGLAFSYSKGDFEDKAADWNDSDIDNYSLQGYLTWSACNGFFANLFGGYTWTDNEIRARYVAENRYADYDSSTWNIGGNLGYSFTWLDRLAVTPTVGLHYIKAKADAHTRFMNGIAQSSIDKASAKALLLPVNINARYDIEFSNCSRLSIEGNVGYSYNFKRDSAIANITMNGVAIDGGAVVLRSQGREQSRHTWNFGGGLRYSYNAIDFAVKYDYYTQSDVDAHRVMGTVGVSF